MENTVKTMSKLTNSSCIMTMATENIKKKYFFIFKNDFPKIDYINRI